MSDDRDEIVPEGDMYDFPDAYFVRLEEYETNSPEYCLVQGAVYDFLKSDIRADSTDAVEVSRKLNMGEVEEAWDYTTEVLEDG